MLDDEKNHPQYPEYQHGIKPGTSARTTPLKHVQMFQRHFSEENVTQAIEYLKSEGETVPPLFVSVDTRGEWTTKEGSLFWQATDGSTKLLKVVTKDRLEEFIKEQWYRQDVPSGIESLHKFLCRDHIGVSYSAVKKFVQRQKPWQMIKNMPKKSTARSGQLSMLAKRPFSSLEIDIADMVSFGQTIGKDNSPRYILVLVDNFSGFCLAEIQFDKEGPTTLASLKKMLEAIKALKYKRPFIMLSDQGPEFQGPGWDALDEKMGWKRMRTKNYPAVRAERKIQTLKKYIRLNSTLTRGPGTYWYNVVPSSVKAVNNIYQAQRWLPV